jgi:hypothetical protein
VDIRVCVRIDLVELRKGSLPVSYLLYCFITTVAATWLECSTFPLTDFAYELCRFSYCDSR